VFCGVLVLFGADSRTFVLRYGNRAWFYAPVRGISSLLKYWLPVVLWMALIFSASSDSMSSGRTSRIIGPLVRWFVPNITEAALDRMVFAVRKTAHVTEYAVLALLWWRAWRGSAGGVSERGSVEAWERGSVGAWEQGAAVPRSHAPTLRRSDVSTNRGWRWSEALLAFTVAALYAASAEFHQSFVPHREARFGDVLIDSAGAAIGLLCLWLLGRWRRRW